MTVYAVAYYNQGIWDVSQLMLDSTAAQNTFNWYQSLQGTTYVVILSWTATKGATWGTPPAGF